MSTTTTPSFVLPPGMDGLFGGNNAGGLLGGLILGALLYNRGGGLFGNQAGEVGAVATQQGVSNAVNQSAIQQELAAIRASIPLAEAQLQTALGAQSLGLTQSTNDGFTSVRSELGTLQNNLNTQFQNSNMYNQAGFTSLNTNLNTSVNQLERQLLNIQSSVSELSKDNAIQTGVLQASISNDGDKTRALLVAQYEATLNRQLSDANARIVALENQNKMDNVQRNIEVNTTNNINQAQSQAQQQQQFQTLANYVANLANDLQYIRATNQAINIGSGGLVANPANNNTNVRA